MKSIAIIFHTPCLGNIKQKLDYIFDLIQRERKMESLEMRLYYKSNIYKYEIDGVYSSVHMENHADRKPINVDFPVIIIDAEDYKQFQELKYFIKLVGFIPIPYNIKNSDECIFDTETKLLYVNGYNKYIDIPVIGSGMTTAYDKIRIQLEQKSDLSDNISMPDDMISSIKKPTDFYLDTMNDRKSMIMKTMKNDTQKTYRVNYTSILTTAILEHILSDISDVFKENRHPDMNIRIYRDKDIFCFNATENDIVHTNTKECFSRIMMLMDTKSFLTLKPLHISNCYVNYHEDMSFDDIENKVIEDMKNDAILKD